MISDEIAKRIKDIDQQVADSTVLVIGGGIGGLTSAALLAKKGISVCLVEQNNEVGGYFGGFSEGNASFDNAISYALSLNESGAAGVLLKELGIEDKLNITKLKKLDVYIFGDKKYYMSDSLNGFRDYLIGEFPAETENIISFFDWLYTFYKGIESTKANPFIIKYFLKDYEAFVRSHFTDQRLINILSIRIQACPASLLIMGGFINECLIGGMYYVRGGYREFSLTLAETISNYGGRVCCGQKISRIEYDKEKAEYTVFFESGKKMLCKYIVSNISPMKLCNMIDDKDHLCDKLIKNSEKRKIGHSSISVYLRVKNVDLSKWDNGRIYILPDNPEFDIFKYYEDIENGNYNKNFILKVHIPTRYDDSLCDEGDIIRVETDMCIDYFESLSEKECEAEKNRILQYVLQKLDENINEKISEQVFYSKVLIPTDFEKMFGSDRGSGTGWAHTVSNYFRNIFPTKTSVPNVYIVGQWGQLGSGLRQLVLTGRMAAEDIASKEKVKDEG